MPKRRPPVAVCERCSRRPQIIGLRYCIACRDYLVAKMRRAAYIEDVPTEPHPTEFGDRASPRGTNRPSERA